ncbi:hypothetical protein F2P81_014435 [Scophthalmus maximus]|uniref:Uncharacterized protein n=1 Tax=Scophthalmus maximus TaxID=52904 RepID=A0A6A4SNU4_SCOMX|nr:hypothetical protein F2P81_014435 [Scophthalmus maximus]
MCGHVRRAQAAVFRVRVWRNREGLKPHETTTGKTKLTSAQRCGEREEDEESGEKIPLPSNCGDVPMVKRSQQLVNNSPRVLFPRFRKSTGLIIFKEDARSETDERRD